MHDDDMIKPGESDLLGEVHESPASDAPVEIRSHCAERAIALALNEASTAGSGQLASHHLLIGLSRVEEGIAAAVLTSTGHTPESLRSGARFVLAPSGGNGDSPPNSPRVKRVIENAAIEARKRNHQAVGTLHILHSIVREQAGVSVFLLETPGVGLELIGTAIARAFRENPADPE